MILFLFLILHTGQAYGQEMEVPLIPSGTEEEMNKYEMPDGRSFSTNLKPGDQAAMVGAFSFEDGLLFELYKDGKRISYTNEMLIQESGSYEMKIISSYGEDTVYCLFPFSIAGFSAEYMDQFQFGNMVEQPDMKMEFDKSSRDFLFTFPNGKSFRTTIPQGGLTQGEVVFQIPDDMTAVVRYNDRIQTSDAARFWQPGNYMIVLTSMPDMQGRTSDYNSYVLRFYFRIIPAIVNDTEIINAPEGFSIRSVTRNGAGVKVESRRFCHMKADGQYRIIFASEKEGVEYDLELFKDTVAPLLNIEKSYDFYGNIRQAVYEKREQDSTVTVKLNGSLYQSESRVLTEGGVYVLKTTDEAGNVREYKLMIPFAREFTLKNKIIVILVLLLTVSGFMIYTRRNMRVL